MTHRCYSCWNIFISDQLRFECGCYHPSDNIHYRGICIGCEHTPRQNWHERPDGSHILTQIHQWTPEYQAYLHVHTDIFNGRGIVRVNRVENGTQFSIINPLDAPTDEALFGDISRDDPKTTFIPDFVGRKCTCCPDADQDRI